MEREEAARKVWEFLHDPQYAVGLGALTRQGPRVVDFGENVIGYSDLHSMNLGLATDDWVTWLWQKDEEPVVCDHQHHRTPPYHILTVEEFVARIEDPAAVLSQIFEYLNIRGGVHRQLAREAVHCAAGASALCEEISER